MSNPLDKFKKLKGRSWAEIRIRGEQAFSAYAEQMGLSGKMPTDEEFDGVFLESEPGGEPPTAENLFEAFRRNSQTAFFQSFKDAAETGERYKNIFGENGAKFHVEKAERILKGDFAFLGYESLVFGNLPDWHLEPLSGKRAPLKHWKQFDELDASETGDKKIVWELNRHQYFFTLGAAYNLTKDEKFAETFVAHLEDWMRENPPGTGINWASSLEVAFRAISWIWAFNFFRESPKFTPEIFRRSLKYLYLHGLHIEKYLSTYYSPNTHITGEALGLYYLGTQFPFFRRAAFWRETGSDILLGELDRQIFEDGVYFEQTTWYQKYTADFYAHFLILKMLDKIGTNGGESQKIGEKLQSVLDFLMYITRPDGSTPIIGDDDGGRALPLTTANSDDFRGTLAVGAVLFERGDYKFVAESSKEEVLWLFGKKGDEIFQKLPPQRPAKTSVDFPQGGYYISRDGWAKTDNYLLVDCGEIGSLAGGHGHADTLSVELAVRGRNLLIDSGTYTYHQSKELRDYFRSSAAHNSLTIDGKSSSAPGAKFNWKTKARARVESWISEERFDFFKGSHDGYQNLDANHQRSVLFLKNEYWIMRDYVKTAGQHDYSLNFHFAPQIVAAIEKTAAHAVYVTEENAPENWRLFTFGDNGAWHNETAPVSNFYGRKNDAPFLKFVAEGRGAQEFFTFILPLEKDFPPSEIVETAVSGGRAFVIKYLGYTDFFVFADSGEKPIRTEFFNSNFRFFWARLSTDEKIPEEFVMIDGSKFSLGKREILNHPEKISFAVARRLGNKLNVKTNEGIFSVSLSHRKTKTLVFKG